MMKNKHKSQKVAQHMVDVMQRREPQYKEEFKEWIEENEYALDCVNDFSDKEKLSEMIRNFTNETKEEDSKELIRKINRVQSKRRFLTATLSMSAVVAAVAVFLWVDGSIEQPVRMDESTKEIALVENVPTLITSHGEKIHLDNSENIVIGKNITFNQSGALEINSDMSTDSTVSSKINKLIVPSKNNFTIKLADGTKVILNANSTLEFPENFSGDSRNVILTGEGYFEVTKDTKNPFTVSANGVKVQVHGTKFNINTFRDEDVLTFLLEGSVSVASDRMEKILLKPMQAVSTNVKNGAYTIKNIENKETYLSWLDNNFVFKATPLKDVTTQLENWYGVKFDRKNLSDSTLLLTGIFCRNTDFSELIKAIQISIQAEIIKENNLYYINLKK